MEIQLIFINANYLIINVIIDLINNYVNFMINLDYYYFLRVIVLILIILYLIFFPAKINSYFLNFHYWLRF